MASCRSCRIAIDWAALPDGTAIPLDRASAGDPSGNLAVRRTEAGTLAARYLRKGDEPTADEKRGISHFATCPQAGQHRRSRG